MSEPENASRTILYANFGAEERRDAKRASRELLRLASLWQGVFPQDAEVVLPPQAFPPNTRWERAVDRAPSDVGGPSEQDATSLLVGRFSSARGLVRWLPDEWSADESVRLGVGDWGPDPRTVAKVHDKAFSVRSAAAIATTTWSALPTVLEPEDLRSPGVVEGRVAEWPGRWRSRFVLKPRMGTSARGRVSGQDGRLEEAGRRGLPRLASRGGAILEPWFDRVDDLSAQYWIESGGHPELLGTTRQLLGENGIYLGNEGVFEIEETGRLHVRSGHGAESQLIHDSMRLVEFAAAAGFHGPCGVDAFTYTDDTDGEEREVLRSIVELNARFTTGTIALGWLEKICREVVRRGESRSGRWRFLFAPELTRRLVGDRWMPRNEEGWLPFLIGPQSDPSVLALKLSPG